MKAESIRKYHVTDVINQNYNVQTACVLCTLMLLSCFLRIGWDSSVLKEKLLNIPFVLGG